MDVASTDLSPELRTPACPPHLLRYLNIPSKELGIRGKKRLDKNKRMVLKFYLLELEQNLRYRRMSKKASRGR